MATSDVLQSPTSKPHNPSLELPVTSAQNLNSRRAAKPKKLRQRTVIRLYQDRREAQMAVTALLEGGVKQDCIFHSGNLGRDDITNVSLSELDLSKAQRTALLAGLRLNGVVVIVASNADQSRFQKQVPMTGPSHELL